MKKRNVFFIFFIVYNLLQSSLGYSFGYRLHNTSNISYLEQTVKILKHHALFISSLPIIVYYNEDIANYIKNHPLLSSVIFYFFLHACSEAALSFKEQHRMLETIKLLKKISLYFVISHGIKNHLQQKHLSTYLHYEDKDFFNNLTKYLPYTFEEINVISLQAYQEIKASLHKINPEINIQSEEFIFLCHAHFINLETLYYLTEDDPYLFQKLKAFETHPELELACLIAHLQSEITNTFLLLEQNLFNHPYQTYTAP